MTYWRPIFAAATAAALASAVPAFAEPPGSYRDSCTAVTSNYEDVLAATCRTQSGEARRSTLALPGCRGDIANDDGRLTCRDSYGRPRYGNWQDVEDNRFSDGNDGRFGGGAGGPGTGDRFGNNNSNADRFDNSRGNETYGNAGDDRDGRAYGPNDDVPNYDGRNADSPHSDRPGDDDGQYTPPRPISPPPDAVRSPAAVVYAYDDLNYRGRGLTFRTAVPDLSAFGFNDRITSLYTPNWRDWVVCTDRNYRGRCIRVNDARDLRRLDMNNRISSMYPAR